MAYELSKKVVIDTEEFNDYAVGLSLPLKNGDGGFFEQNLTTFDQARSNLKNLLLTKKGERVLQPNFGSGLQDLLEKLKFYYKSEEEMKNDGICLVNLENSDVMRSRLVSTILDIYNQ